MSSAATIAALSTGQGRAAIAIIRLSGPATRHAVEQIAGTVPPPRCASLRSLTDPADGSAIDEALVLWFPAPHSFTGEDSAEFHIHGGRSVVSGLLSALTRMPGVRLAEPGEFARQAFDNGKLDLTKVEALADLIDADTAMQRRQALRQMEGALGRQVEDWRRRLIKACAWVEALIDFSDESDVDSSALTEGMQEVMLVRQEIATLLSSGDNGERLREGMVVAIAGAPNAGKSTLLNILAGRDAAIVSPHAGTTLDLIEISLDVAGWPVRLIDTAGIRDSSDPVEQEGVRRARSAVRRADLTLWLSEHADESLAEFGGTNVIRVRTKCDLLSDSAPKHGENWVNISSLNGQGIGRLLSMIADRAERALGGETALITRARHRDALADLIPSLDAAWQLFQAGGDEELVAEEIRLALRSLGRITGIVDVEDVLGAIFAGFCIGK